jgi:hypothetical protein
MEIKGNQNIDTEIHEIRNPKLRNFEDPLGVQGNKGLSRKIHLKKFLTKIYRTRPN